MRLMRSLMQFILKIIAMLFNRYRSKVAYRNSGRYRTLFRVGLIVRGIAKTFWLTQKLKPRTAIETRPPR